MHIVTIWAHKWKKEGLEHAMSSFHRLSASRLISLSDMSLWVWSLYFKIVTWLRCTPVCFLIIYVGVVCSNCIILKKKSY